MYGIKLCDCMVLLDCLHVRPSGAHIAVIIYVYKAWRTIIISTVAIKSTYSALRKKIANIQHISNHEKKGSYQLFSITLSGSIFVVDSANCTLRFITVGLVFGIYF